MVDPVYIPTLKIKSTHPPSQGDFVVINEVDFDPEKGHVLYEDAGAAVEHPAKASKKSTKASAEQ